MVRLVRITYVLRGEYHTATLTKGEARLVRAALTRAYPGITIEEVEVVG
jgi:hypothetical protein